MAGESGIADLPKQTGGALADFVKAAEDALGDHLRSIVLFGSAAEGRLRPTSDVNVVLVLSRFEKERGDRLRGALRSARATIRLLPMLLLESEIESAVAAFPEKFADIRRRRRVLRGADPFATLAIPREILIGRLRQVLLNLELRLRQHYVLRSLREEQSALLVAEVSGPLRASAATVLELEGAGAVAPKEALERFARSLSGGGWDETLASISSARADGILLPGTAGPLVFRILDLVQELLARAGRLDARRP